MPESYTLKPYQSCRSNEGWHPVRIASSTADHFYTILVSPWGRPVENMCECPGYTYRGYCRHQDEASATICRWAEPEDPKSLGHTQTPDQRRDKVCPRCGGPTKWEIEVIDEIS